MSAPEQHDDQHLIDCILAGELNAFTALVERHRDYVFAVLARHLPATEVPGVAQDVWLRAYGGLAKFRGRASFRTWLHGLAARAACDFWRTHYRRKEVLAPELGDRHRDWLEAVGADAAAAAFAEQVERREATEVLHWALAELSAEDRMVLSLVHLESRSVREAAELLGWSQINVKVRAHRARKRLRRQLLTMMETEDEGRA